MNDVVTLKISAVSARTYLRSRTCQCGRRKAAYYVTCRWCHAALPELLRKDLDRTAFTVDRAEQIEAMENALEFLELPLPPRPDLETAARLATKEVARERAPNDTKGESWKSS